MIFFSQRHQCQHKKDLCDCGAELIVKTSEICKMFYLNLAPCSSGLCWPAGPVFSGGFLFPKCVGCAPAEDPDYG